MLVAKIFNYFKYILLKIRYFFLPRRSLDIIKDYFYVRSLHPQFMKLRWEPVEDGPIERVEPACAQVQDKLYVMGGYHSLDKVVSTIDVIDLSTGKWIEHRPMPAYIPQTHQGVDCEDGRFIYHVAGQRGIQCSPAVADCYVYDIVRNQWEEFPPLPKARYAAATRLLNGRLHVVAGSREDRVTPATEHWSIAVKDGKAQEERWQEEPAIPLGGPHRSSAVVGDKLYVLASQHGDRPPIAGDLKFTCDWKAPNETFFKDSFAYNPTTKSWRRIADMPVAVTHTEYSTLVLENLVVILGGFTDGRMLTHIIQVYDTKNDQWRIVGKLPWRNKGLAAGYYDGWLYMIAGQKQVSAIDPGFGEVLKGGHRAKF